MSDINDPWSSAAEVVVSAAPEAPVAVPSMGGGSPHVAVKDARTIVPTPEGKLTLTFKGTGTFADRWLVAHVANPAEGLTLLKDPEFKELLDLSKRIAAYDGAGAAAPAPQGGSAPARSNAPQGATEAPSWAAPKPFDDFVYKTGVSAKNGKTWHAWMPPTKDDQRAAKFFYPPN
jgi:hypothetical protein